MYILNNKGIVDINPLSLQLCTVALSYLIKILLPDMLQSPNYHTYLIYFTLLNKTFANIVAKNGVVYRAFDFYILKTGNMKFCSS